MITNILNFFFVVCDAPNNYSFRIQDPCTPAAEGMIFFHNYLLFFLIAIGFVIIWFLFKVIYNSENNILLKTFTHSSFLEIGWTILPAILLLFMAVPSFCLLYSLDELSKNTITLKIIGHQWYWSYEYLDTQIDSENDEIVSFDSYIIDVANDFSTTFGMFRLLEVDNRVVLPIKTHIKLLISSSDVLHSWAVPSFGVKVDACPGRLSEASVFLKRKGVFYGQCSEICGINHGFMPIVVAGVDFETYIDWLFANQKINKNQIHGLNLDVDSFQLLCKKALTLSKKK
jgi:cytochrome c oxidase subunit 2